MTEFVFIIDTRIRQVTSAGLGYALSTLKGLFATKCEKSVGITDASSDPLSLPVAFSYIKCFEGKKKALKIH